MPADWSTICASILRAAGELELREPPVRAWSRLERAIRMEREHARAIEGLGRATSSPVRPRPDATGVRDVARRGRRAHASPRWSACGTRRRVTSTRRRPRTPGAGAPITANDAAQSVETELRQAEAHYEKAIKGLEVIANSEQSELDPRTAATLQKNLAVIDQAISESRAAVRAQPASEPAQQSLIEGFKTKIGAAAGHRGADQRNAQGQRGGRGAHRRPVSNRRAPDMRLSAPFVIAALALVAAPAAAQDDGRRIVVRDVTREVVREVMGAVKPGAYQGRNNGPEQTERFSRKVKIGRDGRFSLNNISGDIVVTAGSGDEVSIEAVKRTRGDKSELANVQIMVDDRAGRVDVRTEHEQNRRDRNGRSDHVSVDYTVTVPASVSVDLHSVSGSVKVTGVHGSLRAETVSGDVTVVDAPRLEAAKTVSGDVVADRSHGRRRPVGEQRERQRASEGAEGSRPRPRIGERRHQRQRRRRASAWASSR